MTKQADPSEIFKERLKTAREELRQWNQSELAGRAGLPPSSIAHFEIGVSQAVLRYAPQARERAGGYDRLPAWPCR